MPEDFQTTEFVKDHGGIDLVVERKYLRSTISTLLSIFEYRICLSQLRIMTSLLKVLSLLSAFLKEVKLLPEVSITSSALMSLRELFLSTLS